MVLSAPPMHLLPCLPCLFVFLSVQLQVDVLLLLSALNASEAVRTQAEPKRSIHMQVVSRISVIERTEDREKEKKRELDRRGERSGRTGPPSVYLGSLFLLPDKQPSSPHLGPA